MTEQEAMIRLDFIRCALLGGTKPEIIPNEDNVELMDNAIKALEDVKQYRAIGTPEECRAAVEKQKAMIAYCDENDCAGCPYHNGQLKENRCMNDFIADEIVKGGGVNE